MSQMDGQDKLLAILCGTVIVIALMILLFQRCNNLGQQRVECIKAGRSTAECKEAFTP